MKEIDLPLKNKSEHQDVGPIMLSENVKIEGVYDIAQDKYTVECTITRNEKNIGRFTFNEGQGRLFVNCELDDIKRNTKREIVEDIASIILQLVPMAADIPVEEAGE